MAVLGRIEMEMLVKDRAVHRRLVFIVCKATRNSDIGAKRHQIKRMMVKNITSKENRAQGKLLEIMTKGYVAAPRDGCYQRSQR